MSFGGKVFGAFMLCAATVGAFTVAYIVLKPPSKIITGDRIYEISESGTGTRSSALRQGTDRQYDGNTGYAVTTEPAMAQPDRITSDTTIVYEYAGDADGSVQRLEQNAPAALFNLTRTQLAERIEGYTIESFSSSEVVLRKNAPRIENYVLGIWDGRVAVFYADSGVTENGLKEVTDTPVSSLSEDEQMRLKLGVVIEGSGQLMKVLEDYGS